MLYKLGTYILFLIILSSCSSDKNSKINNKKTSNSSSTVKVDTPTKSDYKKQQYACSSSNARSEAFRRLWKIYGKEDIRMPYKVKSKDDTWDVYGYRNKEKEYGKTVHVIIPKNNKNCSIKEIKHEYLKFCTRIGCDNSITVRLSSPLKPGKYSIYTKFDNEKKSNKTIITVSKGEPNNCKRHKNIPHYFSSLLNFSDCKNSQEIIKIGSLSHFTISNEPNPIEQTLDPIKMSITIKNSKGISILKKEVILRYKKQNSRQPNGKDCEPICYKATIKI